MYASNNDGTSKSRAYSTYCLIYFYYKGQRALLLYPLVVDATTILPHLLTNITDTRSTNAFSTSTVPNNLSTTLTVPIITTI